VMLAAGCTSHPVATPTPSPTAVKGQARTAMPAAATSVVPGASAAELAIATSHALFTSAPAVVLAALDDAAAITKAATTATGLGVPLLLSPASPKPSASASPAPSASPATSPSTASVAADPVLQTELTRLAPQAVVTVGDGAAAYERATSTGRTVAVGLGPSDDSALPNVSPAPPLNDLLVLALPGDASTAAIATAKA